MLMTIKCSISVKLTLVSLKLKTTGEINTVTHPTDMSTVPLHMNAQLVKVLGIVKISKLLPMKSLLTMIPMVMVLSIQKILSQKIII